MGANLIKAFFSGDISLFPMMNYDNGNGLATNYSLFFNILVAVWLLPVYTIDALLFHNSMPFIAYEYWYKLSVLLTTISAGYYIVKIAKCRLKDNKKAYDACLLFLSSAALNEMIIVQGQCDVIAVLFTLIGFYHAISKKYKSCAIFFGIAILIKPYIFLCEWPAIVLFYSKVGRKPIRWLSLLVLFFMPFMVDRLITKILMPDYYLYAEYTDALISQLSGGISFRAAFFAMEINGFMVFPGVVLLTSIILLYLSANHNIPDWLFPVCVCLLFIYMAFFVSFPVYHFVMVAPFASYLVVSARDKKMSMLLNFGFNMGYFLWYKYLVYDFLGFFDGATMGYDVWARLFSFVFSLLSGHGEVAANAGITIMVCCLFALLLQSVYENLNLRKKNALFEETIAPPYENLLLFLQLLPVVLSVCK